MVIFYKYCKISDYLVQSLFEKNIFLNEPKHFNDPAESNFNIDWNQDVENMGYSIPLKVIAALLEEGLIQTKNNNSLSDGDLDQDALTKPMNRSSIESFCYKIIRDAQKSYRITSFTTNASNPLMWGHYSDGMRGVSIGYRIPKKYLKKVVYGIPYKVNIKNILSDNAEKEVVETFLRKHKDWKYEKEFRLIDRNDFFEIEDQQLYSLTFGYKCNPSKAKFVMDLVNKVYDSRVIFKVAYSLLGDYGVNSFVVNSSEELFETLEAYEKREEIYEEFEMDRTVHYFESLLEDLDELDKKSEIKKSV